MKAQTEKPVFGYPKFWEESHREFQKFFELVIHLQDSLNSLTTRSYARADPCQKVILNLGMLTGVSMVELTTLVGNGLGPGAMKVARSMLESAINAEYLRLFPAEYEDYRDWHWVEQKQLLDYLQANAPELLQQIPAENRRRTEAEFQRVRSRFEYQTNKGPRLRGYWCARNLADRAVATNFSEPYRIIQPLASQILHGSFGGLAAHFDPAEEDVRIAIPPSLNWCREALLGGHLCVLRTVETLANTFGVEPHNPIKQLVEDYRYVWGKPAADLTANASPRGDLTGDFCTS